MKKFDFRLESVLRLRNTQLAAEQQKMQALLAQERRLRDSLQALETQRQKATSSVHAERDLSALDLRSLAAFVMGTQVQAISIRENIARQSQAIAEQRKHLLQAERNLQLLKKLREKRLTEWTAEMEREIELGAQEAWLATHRPSSPRRSAAESPDTYTP